VAHFAGVYFASATLDGQSVGMLALRPGAPVPPSLLSGQELGSAGQIVVGPATLSALDKHVGQTVVLRTDAGRAVPLRIVGTATLPTVGGSGDPSMGMGTGAVVASSLFSAGDLNQQGSQLPGPMAELISVRQGVRPAVALASLNQIVQKLNAPSDVDAPVGGVVAALRPAEIADYDSAKFTTGLLAAVLALAAIAALGLTLTASVRSRRREFALLKALGFTHRQLGATVAWQSTVAAVLGVVVGVPVGIALGRWLWTLFADGIDAVPLPTVPVLEMVLVALGAVVFANLVALLPARIAARTPTVVLLRAE
jgi:ABC-type antimicrobial peptide transport system permease subunit